MQKIDFTTLAHIYFIGIGGVSMSGLAKILQKKGFRVSGSDMQESELSKELEKAGIPVDYRQTGENLGKEVDYVVYTAAIRPDHPEYQKAVALGIPLVSRAALLGQIMQEFEEAIAVSGTHGKTSTTGMLTHILLEGAYDPTVSIGGILESIGGNLRLGGDKVFLTEACEYTNSFLDLHPSIEIILNIEADHLDFFTDLEDIRRSFGRFIERMDERGLLVIDSSVPQYEKLCENFKGKLVTSGKKGADVWAEQISFDEEGRVSFRYTAFGQEGGEVRLALTGEHNVYNALAAIAVALHLGIDRESIKRGLESFGGAKRRFEKKGVLPGNIQIIDDYAHHPREIEVSLKAARKRPHGRLVCVFQPHTYTRTKAFLQEFAEALSLADVIVLAKIYAARETQDLGVSSEDIAKLLLRAGKEAYYIDNFDDLETFLLEKLSPQDMCITMGAGDIVKVGERLLGN